MKKTYDNPICRVIDLQDEDVITASLTLANEGNDGGVIYFDVFQGGQG